MLYEGLIMKDLVEALTTDIGLYGGALGFIFIYAVFIIGRCNPVYCRINLALAMIAVWAATLVMSAGFIGYCQIPYTSSNAFLSYLSAVLVILYTSFMVRSINNVRLTPEEARGEIQYNYAEKFAEGFGYVMSSIFKTSIIVIFTFLVGLASPIIAIRSFCAVGAFLWIFLFAELLLFLGPILYYDTKRILANKKDCCGLCICDPESCLFCHGRCVVDKQADKKAAFTDVFILQKMVPFLRNNWVRTGFVIFYVCVIIVGIVAIFFVR
jgi:hypothetical protein